MDIKLNEGAAWAIVVTAIAISVIFVAKHIQIYNVEVIKTQQQHYHDSISVILSGKK